MILLAAIDAGLLAALSALAGAVVGGLVSLLKIGPERQTLMVTAQDSVIENLGQEVDRVRRLRDEDAARHADRMTRLERKMAEEAELCERRIGELQAEVDRLKGASSS